MDMQRLPLRQRRVALQLNDHPFRSLRRPHREQPVAAIQRLFLRIANNIQGDTLASPGLPDGLVLGVQTAHAHRFIDPGQPQRITHIDLARQRRSGHHQPGTFNRKGPVDRQAKTLVLRVRTGGQLQ